MKEIESRFKQQVEKTASLLVMALIIFSCTPKMNPDIQRGSDYNYKPGYPQVRFSSVGSLNENNKASINIAADIVYGSLIYKEDDGKQKADISIDIRAVSQDEENASTESKHYDLDIEKNDPDIVHSQDSFIFKKQLEVSPGNYKVYFTITDNQSEKKITLTDKAYIPNPENNVINLTDVRMFGKDMDDDEPHWYPITTYSVQGHTDSLKFIFQVTNNNAEEPLAINTELIKFKSDQSVARPMYYADYSPSSIEYKGINFDKKTVIAESQRRLIQEGSVFIELKFDSLPRGNYRFQITAAKGGGELYKARDFGVKYKYYPAIQTSRAMARPLIYLMDEGEYEEMMKISDPKKLKQAVDRFWLKHLGNEATAKQVIKKYYKRVVEANKQFSNFKAGWKTDAGMIYILFGPPWYVEKHLNKMIWSFAYNRSDFEYNYFFFQPKMKNAYYPFEHWILERNPDYFNVVYRQRQLWLSGLILQRNV